MSDGPSSYYPPRARWTRHFYHALYVLRRALHLEHLGLPDFKTTPPRLFLSFAVPGFSFRAAGWKTIGNVTLFAWLAMACIFLMWLGHVAANMAFGLMMSMHVSSILYLLNRALPEMSVWRRLLLSLAVLFVVGQLVYVFALNWFQNHLFMPLRIGDKVCVVNRLAVLDTVRRGDTVAYHFARTGAAGVYIREGYALDRILAGPFDQVEFSPVDFRVNGVSSARLPLMPVSGAVELPEKTWLVWPALNTIARNNADERAIASSVLKIAMVPREEMIGKPLRRWFWRKQIE